MNDEKRGGGGGPADSSLPGCLTHFVGFGRLPCSIKPRLCWDGGAWQMHSSLLVQPSGLSMWLNQPSQPPVLAAQGPDALPTSPDRR